MHIQETDRNSRLLEEKTQVWAESILGISSNIHGTLESTLGSTAMFLEHWKVP